MSLVRQGLKYMYLIPRLMASRYLIYIVMVFLRHKFQSADLEYLGSKVPSVHYTLTSTYNFTHVQFRHFTLHVHLPLFEIFNIF